MSFNESSNQLLATLRASITTTSSRRPLLTHLNADTTWLLSLPYPADAPNPRNPIYYHILIDPWLRGGQSDVARFFSQQWHVSPSSVQTITELEEAIRGIEDVAQHNINRSVVENGVGEDGKGNWIDAVAISHEFTDHMHKETLLDINPSIPIFAAEKAASSIQSWKHFDFVATIPRFSGDWRTSLTSPLPEWLSISRVAYPGPDLLYYHSAIMFTFSLEDKAEAIIYTPHGISPAVVALVKDAKPKIETLALLHGLQDISLGAQLNKGAHNGLKVQRVLQAKYWIGTHDEIKKGGGIVSWFLDRKVITFEEAMRKESKERGDKGVELGEVRFVELGNGKSLVLE